MSRLYVEEFLVVYRGRLQFRDVERRLSNKQVRVEALTEGNIGIRGYFDELNEVLLRISGKVFAFPGSLSVLRSGSELLEDLVLNAEYQHHDEEEFSFWPPRTRQNQECFYFDEYDLDEEDDSSTADTFDDVCHLM